ncbi:O-antigen ligase family protein [Thermoleophilia bacterium SCSIO 60948]|nr:O-antigen ligase family protein [Thermoleophilia bacterium SCSIO 60948]
MSATLVAPRGWLPAAALGLAAVALGILAGYDPALAVVAAIGLAFTLVVMANLYAGLVMFIVISFVSQVPMLAGAGLSFAKITGLLLAISWFATTVTRADRRSELPAAHPLFTGIVVLFLVWLTLSRVWADDGALALDAAYRIALNAVLFLIVFTAVRTRRQVLGVVAAVAFGASFDAVYGLLFAAPNEGDTSRLASNTQEPGELAAICVAGLAFAVSLIYAWRDPLARLSAGLVGVVCIAAVFLTGSRGGLVSLAVALAAFVAVSSKQRIRMVLFAGVSVLAAFAFFNYAATPELRERVVTVDDGSGRVDLWNVGWRMVEDEPITGVGAGNFANVAPDYLLQPGVIQRADYFIGAEADKVAHNTFLEFWAETGLVGLLLFVGIVVFCLVCSLRAAGRFDLAGDRAMSITARALFVALAALLAAAFFASRQYSKDLWLLLALAPALLNVAQAMLAEQRREAEGDGDGDGDGEPSPAEPPARPPGRPVAAR